MPTCKGAPLGAPCWIDLSTSDVERAKDFYGTVFGWTFESAGPEYGGYISASKDGQPVAGLTYNDPQWNSPDVWTTYLHTADITTTLSAATSAGATTGVEPMEIKDKGGTVIRDAEDTPYGRLAAVADPAGAGFNLSSLDQGPRAAGHLALYAGCPAVPR